MDKEVLNFIDKNFELEFREPVIKELLSIKLKHVMAESKYNLKNTRMSILYLAKGNLSEIVQYSED
ncbi:hypothetical protein D9V96_015110 [Zobellia laminariae]|uniref:hypothetical protein n=1 Tax=Zobellia laminariae TaxID=248906 RepID=UPI0012D942E4|nr:hypothetical protein [Zobellia laminariae]